MPAQRYDNSGSLSRNERKEKDTHPDITGTAMVDGVEYWINGWKMDGEKGTWYSLRFKPKERQSANRDRTRSPEPDIDTPL